MGKSLGGKELGKGLGQRKDGLYYARYSDSTGKVQEKCFKRLIEAKDWQQEQYYLARHAKSQDAVSTMTVDEWFQHWINEELVGLSPNTIRNYRERYEQNVRGILGNKRLSDLKPMHCKAVFNAMTGQYAGSTIRQAYIFLGSMLKCAKENGLVDKHPMDGVRFESAVKAPDEIHFLTIPEQQAFLNAAEQSANYYQYALILETGLRTGEMIALTWDDIDWERHTLAIRKTMEFRYEQQEWRAGPPKTKRSYRTIPLTDRAYCILQDLYVGRQFRKESSALQTTLTYLDRRTGSTKSFCMKDLIFVNWRTGMPTKNSSYDTHLYKLCDKAGIDHFSMHALRHTYATRAIEGGMPPEILKQLLGHESIKTTMDKYVHVTDDSLRQAVAQFGKGISALQKSE